MFKENNIRWVSVSADDQGFGSVTEKSSIMPHLLNMFMSMVKSFGGVGQ